MIPIDGYMITKNHEIKKYCIILEMGIAESKVVVKNHCPGFEKISCGACSNITFPQNNYVPYNEYDPSSKRFKMWCFDLNTLELIIQSGINPFTRRPLDKEWVKMVVPLYLRDDNGEPLQVRFVPIQKEEPSLIRDEIEPAIRKGEIRQISDNTSSDDEIPPVLELEVDTFEIPTNRTLKQSSSQRKRSLRNNRMYKSSSSRRYLSDSRTKQSGKIQKVAVGTLP